MKTHPLFSAGLIGLTVLCATGTVQAQNNQLPNLTNQNPSARFTITDRVWAANPGDASICLWEDDKLAGLNISIDDNSASNIDWWLAQADTYGFKITWFIITELVGGSNPGMHGTWAVFNNVQSLGHEVQSHSMNHLNTNSATWVDIDTEYRGSQQTIETNMPGHKCDFLAYPGGANQYLNNRTNAAKYYAAARGGSGVISAANKIDYFAVNGMSSFNVTNPAVSWSYLPSLLNSNSTSYFRGLACQLFHWINPTNYASVQPLLDFIDANRADLWCGLFSEMTKYGQERDTATLTTSENSSTRIALTLTDQMLDSRFDYPLTIKVRLPAAWTDAKATQNGLAIPSSVIERDGARYALVKAVPDRGEIALTSGAAGFTASPTSGWAPLTVSFTDTSSGVITNRFWDFGDGATTNTTAVNVTHTYTSAGTNTVRLIVSSSAGTDTNTQNGLIRVMLPQAPAAGFSVSPSSGTAPLPVSFTDTSTGTITNRFWDFGDGIVTNTAATNLIHVYTGAGTNSVRLIVSGPAGVSTSTQPSAVTVTVATAPTANFSASPVSGTAPLNVTFTDTSTGSITNRFWSFGDGATTNTTAAGVSHTYSASGTSTVQLIVSGPGGSSTNTKPNFISVAAAAVSTGNLIVYDPFPGTPTPAGTPATTNTIPAGWISDELTNTNASQHAFVTAGSLTCPGLAASQGNSMSLSTKTSDYYKDFLSPNLTNAGQTVYFSILVRFNSGLSRGMSGGAIRLFNTNNVFGSGVEVGFGNVTNTTGTLSFSLSNRNQVWSQVSAAGRTPESYTLYGTTYLIVGAYTRGSNSTNGLTRLWINPDSATFGTDVPPAATLSTNTYLAEPNWNRLQIISSGTGSFPTNWQLDEVRISTDWAGVVPAESSAPSGDADSDGDGIADSWSTQYFGGPTNANANALAANGVNTVRETYIAGLNPTNAQSVFAVSNDWNTLRWNAASGRVYSVYWATNLMNGFQPLETNIVWPQNSWTGQVAGTPDGVFYKIKVQLKE